MKGPLAAILHYQDTLATVAMDGQQPITSHRSVYMARLQSQNMADNNCKPQRNKWNLKSHNAVLNFLKQNNEEKSVFFKGGYFLFIFKGAIHKYHWDNNNNNNFWNSTDVNKDTGCFLFHLEIERKHRLTEINL